MDETSAAGFERLSGRKREILRLVIQQYVREVHPVSSQAVADEIRVSSATVRNELVALEEQGFLLQPHTSGGRVPTDLAYRFFVEELIQRLSSTLEHQSRVAQVYTQLGRETETLLEGTLDLLTSMTGYVAWVSTPDPAALEIRSVSFVEVDTYQVLVVVVTGAGVMQNRMVETLVPVRELALGRLTDQLNHYLRGRTVMMIDYEELRGIFREAVRIPSSLLQALEDFFVNLAQAKERVLFSNALQLALQPEFTRVEQLTGVLSAINDRERFVRSLRGHLDERRVQAIIGRENDDPGLQQCSLVLSRYQLPGGEEGTLGILGPTRLLYERTLPWVKAIGEAVAQALSDIGNENAPGGMPGREG